MHHMTKKRTNVCTFLCGIAGAVCVVLGPVRVFASEIFTVSPVIVDEKAKQRDILKQTAVLTNNTERKVTLYATVNDIDTVEGQQEFRHRYDNATDIETSLAHWIEISRGVIELEPGETKRIPYLIQVHLNAQPGLYHAKIFFQEGSNRDEAESRIKPWKDIDVNIEILDDATERLQLNSFTSDQVFFTGSTASFSYLLENVGNRSIAPKGEIRIFNRRGEEVATLPANDESVALLPEATSQLGAVWDAGGKFGRYKAYLSVEYGDKQTGMVNDTVFFWIIPWKQILFIFTGLAAAVSIAAYMVYERYGLNKQGGPVLAYAENEELFPARSFSQTLASTMRTQNTRPMRTASTTAVATSVVEQEQEALWRKVLPLTKKSGITQENVQRKEAQQTAARPVSSRYGVYGAVRLESRKTQFQPPSGAVVSLKKRG